MWKIELDEKPHKVELLVSSVSGMKRILKDGYLVFEKQMRFGSFHHSMPIDNHMITIIELDDRYDLRIDNQPFSMLYLSKKTQENFKQESNTKKYEKDHNYESKPKPSAYVPSQPKKKDNFEFDTGFGMFEYKSSHEPLQKSREQKSKHEPEFVTTPWEMEAESEYKAPPPKKENYDWNEPAKFQFEDSTSSIPYKAPTHVQPAPVSQQSVSRAPPPQSLIQQPPPVQEHPLMDLLDSNQPSDLSDDLFADGIGIVPLGNQYKQPEVVKFPQQTTMQTAPAQPTIDAFDFGAPQPSSYPAHSAQPTTYPTTIPAMNQSGQMDYMQSSLSSSTSFTKPTMQPEEKKVSSTDLDVFFENPAPGI